MSRIVIDDRYSPIVVVTFVGATDLAAAQWYEEAQQRTVRAQIARGQKRVISISDATRSERPTPELRRFWAGLIERSPADVKQAMLGTFLVLDSPLMRGAITAISWISPQARDFETFDTVDAAIRAAVAKLERAGVRFQSPTAPYRLPSAD